MTVVVQLTDESARDLRKLLKRTEKKAVYKRIGDYFDRRASVIAGRITENMLSGQRLKRRTGTLARSIVGRGVEVNGIPAMRVGVLRGPALKYAAVQEYGTQGKSPQSPIPTIRPKNAGALAIPVGKALTPAGVDRYGGPKHYPRKLKFVDDPEGKIVGLLFDEKEYERAEKRGTAALAKVKPLWLLVAKVDIKGQHYLRDGFQESLPETVDELAVLLKDMLEVKGGDE